MRKLLLTALGFLALAAAPARTAAPPTTPQQIDQKPKGVLRQLAGSIFTPLLIGLAVGLGTNFFQAKFQAQASLKVWEAQHKADIQSRLLASRIDLLTQFQQVVTEYFSFDAETGILYNFLVIKAATKAVIPDFDPNTLSKNLPSFPTADQSKESSRIWSKLTTLSQSIEVYFGDKIGHELSAFLKTLNAEPTNMLDLHVAVAQIENLKHDGKIDFDDLAALLRPYLTPVPHSQRLNEGLLTLGVDMKCLIKQTAEIEPALILATCPKG